MGSQMCQPPDPARCSQATSHALWVVGSPSQRSWDSGVESIRRLHSGHLGSLPLWSLPLTSSSTHNLPTGLLHPGPFPHSLSPCSGHPPAGKAHSSPSPAFSILAPCLAPLEQTDRRTDGWTDIQPAHARALSLTGPRPPHGSSLFLIMSQCAVYPPSWSWLESDK